MTDHEFQEWFRYHSQTYDLGKWSQANPMALEAWYGALRNYSVQHLMRATEGLLGTPDEPKWPRDHVGAIKRFLQSAAMATPDDQRFPTGQWFERRTYDPGTGEDVIEKDYRAHCPYCVDRGFLAIYLPAAVKCFRSHLRCEIWNAGDGHYTNRGVWCRHVATVSCCCERGLANTLTATKFDPLRMLVWDFLDINRLEHPEQYISRASRRQPVSSAHSGTEQYFNNTR